MFKIFKKKNIEKTNLGSKVSSNQMRFSAVILIGYRNMSINKLRSFLTVGGVAIGIAIITLLISLGFGIQGMVIREVTSNNPGNIIDVGNNSLENFVIFDKSAIGRIENIEGVKDVEISANIGGKFIIGDSQTDVVVNAISEKYLDLASSNIDLEIKKKLFLNPKSVAITPKLATLLGFENPDDSIGKQVEYSMIIREEMLTNDLEDSKEESQKEDQNKDKVLTIVGIVKDQTKDDAVYAYVPIEEIRMVYGKVAGQSVKVSVKDESMVENTRLQIEQLGFSTESVLDTIADINSFFSVVRIILVAFGVIIMSISAMGMLNTLSVSLLQRTKEVGILKALGAKRRDIFKMFIIEAFLISFLGGTIGIAVGYGIAKLINYIINMIAGKYGVASANFVEIPSIFVISIALFIFILGVVTGLFPALRASKLHALEALRYE
ncbi:MAG: hypothetical protein US25_C0001G0013 [Candidatus Moranbacteria bacterium GW2011_GWE1_36_7]|nr:MAG: hypothetical protein UR99_C0005G0008 [Candidatus Moranbacteria bacterium GW2011_GWD2_36_12]KKQ06992.1 MAG: hypothetical protein US16_C0004G0008 [Candidatus Moranbacteria bacterium GW2011_GWE2_36_40]KKQ15618.1 MAG: hypothetical protein US25_C0001G0013 [Candidatus Moranbacteria bacterium GW2011_GWE1_36_7]